jgi:hypothetical protein
VPRFCLGGHEADNMFCEFWVIFAVIVLDTVGPVGSHDDVFIISLIKKAFYRFNLERMVGIRNGDVKSR